MTAKTATAIFLLTLALSTAHAQDPLTVAKELYAAASYEEALSALAQVPADAPPDVVNQSHQYRAFALFALGRTAEAEKAAETIVRMNPVARLSGGDVSPRLEAMFASVRARVLPAVIRDEYKLARVAIDATDLKAAEPHLQTVSRLIAELRANGNADQNLADLNLVVDGFLGLTKALATQPAPAATRPVATLGSNGPAPNSTPTAPPASLTNRPVEQPVSAAPPAATRRPAAASSVIYSTAGPGKVSPPVVVNQTMPALPRTVSEVMRRTARTNLVIELVINERGDVDDAVVKVPVEPVYDLLVARAARGWKYRPATVDGSPVKYRHAVSVAFSER
jgi:hypothetical protein